MKYKASIVRVTLDVLVFDPEDDPVAAIEDSTFAIRLLPERKSDGIRASVINVVLMDHAGDLTGEDVPCPISIYEADAPCEPSVSSS